jgi:hypothetical protein
MSLKAQTKTVSMQHLKTSVMAEAMTKARMKMTSATQKGPGRAGLCWSVKMKPMPGEAGHACCEDGIRWDGTGRDGMRRDGMGWDGTSGTDGTVANVPAAASGMESEMTQERMVATMRFTAICFGYLTMKPNVVRHARQKLEPSIATKMYP